MIHSFDHSIFSNESAFAPPCRMVTTVGRSKEKMKRVSAYAGKLRERAHAVIDTENEAKKPKIEPNAAPAKPRFTEGKIYRDPSTGVRKRYANGAFEDL